MGNHVLKLHRESDNLLFIVIQICALAKFKNGGITWSLESSLKITEASHMNISSAKIHLCQATYSKYLPYSLGFKPSGLGTSAISFTLKKMNEPE